MKTQAEVTTIKRTLGLQPLSVDLRGDIYAAGAVFYEMATWRRPFPQTQSAELVGAMLHQSPVPPSSVNPYISSALESVILKILAKEPSSRYQSGAGGSGCARIW